MVPHTAPPGGVEGGVDARATPVSEAATTPAIAVAVRSSVGIRRFMLLKAFPMPTRFTPSDRWVRSAQVSR